MGIPLKFEYYAGLEKGYKPVTQTEEEKEVRTVTEAMHRATADRAVKALLEDAPNVIHFGRLAV